MEPIPFSVLDRSSIRSGADPAAAVRETVRFAQQVESLGYRRFWVSEHHSVPGVAGSAPTVLAAAVADATSRIRVGTGGVMLPNHRPLVVAEQFGVLAALHPGRIDMGLGRSLGFTGGVRKALGAGKSEADAFTARVREVLGYFAGPAGGVHGFPAEGLEVPAFVLATGRGAAAAGELGSALVISPVHGFEALGARIDEYRRAFRPSAQWPRPYVLVSCAVAVADEAEQARRLLVPEAWSMVRARTTGVFEPLRSAEEILGPGLSTADSQELESVLRDQISGTPSEVARQLGLLRTRTGADEILVTMSTFDRAEMLESYTRLAELAGLTRPTAAG